MPKISVLLPVYSENPAFLDQAIESILAQTVRDFELLILDDGSDVTTAAHLDAWAARDARIRVAHLPHQGITKTLNHGIAESRGAFIARMDGDDIALPHRFKKQIAFLENNLGHALCGSFVQFINEQGNGEWIKKYPTEHEDIVRGLVAHNRFTHAALMFRAAELRGMGGYRDDLKTAQDYDLVLRIARHYKVANIPEVLLKYRYRDASVSWKKHGKQQERDAIKIRWRAIRQYGYPRSKMFGLLRPLLMYVVPKSIKFKIRKQQWDKKQTLKAIAYKLLKQRGPLPRYRDTFSRDAAIAFVDGLRLPFEPFGQWRFSPSNPAPSRFASCFAYFALQELGALIHYTSEQRAEWINYIKNWQREDDGLFHELEENSKTHDVEYIALQLTSFAIEILRAEDTEPNYPIKWLNTISFPTWLYQRNFSDPWKEGNRILFVGELLLHEKRQDMLNQLMSWLNQTVNQNTGFWGTTENYPAMLGAYHQYILYKKLNRRPPYIHTAVTNTLDLQYPDGLFRRYGYGGACEDIDAVEILIQGAPFVDAATQTRVQKVFNTVHSRLTRMQREDGGFAYNPYIALTYSGVPLLSCARGESDLFSAWFRIKTITAIENKKAAV
ncbi:MAG: glycosyltransferase [Patescibacteria group bacterium]